MAIFFSFFLAIVAFRTATLFVQGVPPVKLPVNSGSEWVGAAVSKTAKVKNMRIISPHCEISPFTLQPTIDRKSNCSRCSRLSEPIS
jgi:hypothetical protein